MANPNKIYQSADTGGRTSGTQVAKAISTGIKAVANHSAQAASKANGVSAAAQAAQGTFNQNSANLANSIGTDRIADQYAYNSAQAAAANDFAMSSWNQAAEWNERMWEKNAEWQEKMWQKTAEYNTAEAANNREFQLNMAKTAYQRAVEDMEKAGLNPILAVTGGGISTGSGAGSAASMSAPSSSSPQMSALAGHSASGGLMNGIAASEGNYTGQMEYMGGMLGLLSAALSGISSAMQAMGGMGKVGEGIADAFSQIMNPRNWDSFSEYWKEGRENQRNNDYKPNYRNGIDWNMKNYNSAAKKPFRSILGSK